MGLQDEETGEDGAGGQAKNAVYDKEEVKNKSKEAKQDVFVFLCNLLICG